MIENDKQAQTQASGSGGQPPRVATGIADDGDIERLAEVINSLSPSDAKELLRRLEDVI